MINKIPITFSLLTNRYLYESVQSNQRLETQEQRLVGCVDLWEIWNGCTFLATAKW